MKFVGWIGSLLFFWHGFVIHGENTSSIGENELSMSHKASILGKIKVSWRVHRVVGGTACQSVVMASTTSHLRIPAHQVKTVRSFCLLIIAAEMSINDTELFNCSDCAGVDRSGFSWVHQTEFANLMDRPRKCTGDTGDTGCTLWDTQPRQLGIPPR
jgi:hypothetical protein